MPSKRKSFSPALRDSCGVQAGSAVMSPACRRAGLACWPSGQASMVPSRPGLHGAIEKEQVFNVRMPVHGGRIPGAAGLRASKRGRAVVAGQALVWCPRTERYGVGFLEAGDLCFSLRSHSGTSMLERFGLRRLGVRRQTERDRCKVWGTFRHMSPRE